MGKFEIKNFTVADLEQAIKNVIQESLKPVVLERLNPEQEKTLKLFSREDTASMLCISLPTLHQYTKNGDIIAYRIGGRVLYKHEDIIDAISIVEYKFKRGGKSC